MRFRRNRRGDWVVCEGKLLLGVIEKVHGQFKVARVTADNLVFDVEPSCGPCLFDRRRDAADWIRQDILERLNHVKLRRYGMEIEG